MIPIVKEKGAGWNQKSTESEAKGEQNDQNVRTEKGHSINKLKMKVLGAPLGRFGVPFGLPTNLEGVPKSTIFV